MGRIEENPGQLIIFPVQEEEAEVQNVQKSLLALMSWLHRKIQSILVLRRLMLFVKPRISPNPSDLSPGNPFLHLVLPKRKNMFDSAPPSVKRASTSWALVPSSVDQNEVHLDPQGSRGDFGCGAFESPTF